MLKTIYAPAMGADKKSQQTPSVPDLFENLGSKSIQTSVVESNPLYEQTLVVENVCQEHIENIVSIDAGMVLTKVVHSVVIDTDINETGRCSKKRRLNMRTFLTKDQEDIYHYVSRTIDTDSTLHTTGITKERIEKRLFTDFPYRRKVGTEIGNTVRSLLTFCRRLPSRSFLYPTPERGLRQARLLQGAIERCRTVRGDQVYARDDPRHIERSKHSAAPGGWDQGAQEARSLSLKRSMPCGDLIEDEERPGGKLSSRTYMDQERCILPCIIACLGSAATYILVDLDESYTPVESHSRCGTYLQGLGSLLVNTSSYEELMKLAGDGDEKRIHTSISHLKQTEEGNLFKHLPDELTILTFGEALKNGKDSFKREDLAAALLSSVVQDLVQSSCLTATAHHAKKVFFYGGFVSSELVRNEITKQFYIRQYFGSPKVEPLFLKHNNYLQAMGPLI